MRDAGVPDSQLLPVSGGERLPLFSSSVRQQASIGEGDLAAGPPGAPALPHPSLATMSVQVWPSLHCLMPGKPGETPEVIDTGTIFMGEANPYICTVDLNRGMQYGLLRTGDRVPVGDRDPKLQSFIDYVNDRSHNVFSSADGGQLMFNFLFNGKALLWNSHLGAYEGIMKVLEPKPDVAILGIAGRGNLNGRPFNGSAAQFALNEIRWLDNPRTVIWCLHDERRVFDSKHTLILKLTLALLVLLAPLNHFELIQGQQPKQYRKPLLLA